MVSGIPFMIINLPAKSKLLTAAFEFLGWKVAALAADTMAALTLILFSTLVLARVVHGRELSWSPLECQINTHSTPDAIGISKIVTLVWRTHLKSLRHRIYDHEDCVKVIADWVR